MKSKVPAHAVVIDDDEGVGRRISEVMEPQGVAVAAYTTARDGLQHLDSHMCDVALVDLLLPEMDAPSLISSLRDRRRDIQVLVMAAFPDSQTVQQALTAGAAEWLRKPIEPANLIDAVDRVLAGIGAPARNETAFNCRLGGRLRALRREAGLTLTSVATAAGITKSQLSQIENGRTATTTWTLMRLCAALRVPLARAVSDL